MKKLFLVISITICSTFAASAQTLQDARELYATDNYADALPIFKTQYDAKPNDASINHWYAVCLFMTNGDLDIAEKCLQLAAKRKVYESNMYLGAIYTEWFDFAEADKYFGEYEKHLNRKGKRTKAVQEKEDIALEKLKGHKKTMQQLRRLVSHTEDIQVIDSIIVSKDNFLSAYSLSFSGGSIATFPEIFKTNQIIYSTVYFNEKETKMYYSMPEADGLYGLFMMEYLVDHFGNERQMSADNFDLEGSLNYPFIMPDGVTVYFAAEDPETIGGYDIFISRYNMNNDSYLKPERLSMPFNSKANDYMMVVDDEKGIGWFASDRGMEEGFVCVYTFIPNSVVKIIEGKDNRYLANRARISSIKDTWIEGANYTNLIAQARNKPEKKQETLKDFEFVLNDQTTFYSLDDFSNNSARNAYEIVVQMRAEYDVIAERLELEREKYMSAPLVKKAPLSSSILEMEERQKKLSKDIPELEIKVRNLEIMERGRIR